MVHRNKKPNDIHEGKWNGLGGKFEEGESPEECVIREVLEESGLTIRSPKLHGMLMFPKFKGNDWYVFVFTATEFSGDLIDSPEVNWNDRRESAEQPEPVGKRPHLFPWIKDENFSPQSSNTSDNMRGHSGFP
jgi:8-oxo-dGTP diphosphatase